MEYNLRPVSEDHNANISMITLQDREKEVSMQIMSSVNDNPNENSMMQS